MGQQENQDLEETGGQDNSQVGGPGGSKEGGGQVGDSDGEPGGGTQDGKESGGLGGGEATPAENYEGGSDK